ncbi:MAG: PAS domain-containing sensor histidine kinase [Candidatus Omnitrophota bacterium]
MDCSRPNESLSREKEIGLQILKMAPFGIDIVDPQGHVLYMNGQMEKLAGPADIGKKCWEIYKDDRLQCNHCPLLKGVKYGETESLESQGCCGGRVFRIWHTGIHYEGKDCVLEIFEDVTQQRQAGELLKASEERYRTFVELTGQLGWVTNAQGEVEEDIPTWRRFTGQTQEEVKGWGWIHALHPQDIVKTAALWRESVGAQALYETEYRIRRYDGVYRWFLVLGTPVFREGGGIREWIGTCIDITGRKKLEEAISEKAEQTAKFISVAAHELRSPLAALKDSINCVIEGAAGAVSADQRDILAVTQRSVDRLVRLASDILDFQKSTGPGMTYNFRFLDLNETIRQVVQMQYSVFEKQGLTLELELEAALPWVFFDSDKISQVLVNLLNNARRFTEKGGVVVRSAREGNKIQITVQDTGPGMKPEDMEKLFKPFPRIAGSGGKLQGTGLGLSICKEILDAHRGKIGVESQVGEGSAFYFVLPVEERRE